MKTLLVMLKDAAWAWEGNKATRLSAALAFYALFSLAPLVVIAIAVAGGFFGELAVRNDVYLQLHNVLGDDAAALVQRAVASAYTARAGTLAVLSSVVVLLIGATGFFTQLQDAMNTVWNVRPREGQHLTMFLRHRLVSIVAVAAIAAVLLLSLMLTTFLSAAHKQFGHSLPGDYFIWRGLNIGVNLLILWLMLATIYKVLPDAKLAWRDVWYGAAVAAVLFVIGYVIIGVYLASTSTASAYGAAGSLVVLLIWVYVSAMLFFYGAEFTQAYARHCGRTIAPQDYAEAVS